MNKKTYIILIPLLLLAAGLLAGCIRGAGGDSLSPAGEDSANSDTHLLQDPHLIDGDHVSVDPRIVEDLEEFEWVEVNIGIRLTPEFDWISGPHDDAYVENVRTMDWDLFYQVRDERKAEVVAALGSDYRQIRNAGDHINVAGLEKLRSHPYMSDVTGDYDAKAAAGASMEGIVESDGE